MIAQLKDLGVNFIMTHGYKGAGMTTEAAGMEDARRFAKLARKAGMRVGAYIGGTMLYERLFLDEPLAPQWQAFGPDGGPIFYNQRTHWRYASSAITRASSSISRNPRATRSRPLTPT